MTVSDALRDRRSCRSFAKTPLAVGTLDDLVDRARRTPTAGNCQGVEFLTLEGADVSAYWDTTLPTDRRGAFPWPGLVNAPALVLAFGLPARYLNRYAEPDKEGSSLSGSASDWPVPYWLTDAAFAAMALQLLAVEAGLGLLLLWPLRARRSGPGTVRSARRRPGDRHGGSRTSGASRRPGQCFDAPGSATPGRGTSPRYLVRRRLVSPGWKPVRRCQYCPTKWGIEYLPED